MDLMDWRINKDVNIHEHCKTKQSCIDKQTKGSEKKTRLNLDYLKRPTIQLSTRFILVWGIFTKRAG